VTRIDDINDRLNFRVDRVWKRPVGQQVWIWQLDVPGIDSDVFRSHPGVKYIIFASRRSADDRQFRLNADDQVAFGIHSSCGRASWSIREVRELDATVRGKTPHKYTSLLMAAVSSRVVLMRNLHLARTTLLLLLSGGSLLGAQGVSLHELVKSHVVEMGSLIIAINGSTPFRTVPDIVKEAAMVIDGTARAWWTCFVLGRAVISL
jgi:hypothetical protein